MGRRAERVDETRERITAAAVRLHTTVGPSRTSIASIAEAAGVTRLTVYRHFADLDAVFDACMAHWAAQNPRPDADAWRATLFNASPSTSCASTRSGPDGRSASAARASRAACARS